MREWASGADQEGRVTRQRGSCFAAGLFGLADARDPGRLSGELKNTLGAEKKQPET